MKKIILATMSLLFSSYVFSQSSTIRGVVDSEIAKDIYLYSVEGGKEKIQAFTKLSPDGSFGFIYNTPQEGFYALGFRSNDRTTIQMPIYLKPGDNAEVKITYKKDVINFSFVNKNTPENKTLGRWLALSEEARNMSEFWMVYKRLITFEDFFPQLETLVVEAKNFIPTIKTKNKIFNQSMAELVDFNTEFYALIFMRSPRTKWPEKGYKYPQIYTDMVRENRFANDNVLKMFNGDTYLTMYIDFVSGIGHSAEQVSDEQKNKYMATNLLRGTYYIQNINRAKDYASYLLLKDRYEKYFTAPEHRTAMENVGAKLYKANEGVKAADFTYPDLSGRNVSLSDFIGKVVVVDVWATWCGPCKQQIPYLKKLEEEFKDNKDVVFLAVSVDEQKNYDKWKEMIETEKMGGIHLFANGWSKIAKDYKIKGIPRFMVFDKKGNVVSVEAPRPSQPELKIMIENELKK